MAFEPLDLFAPAVDKILSPILIIESMLLITPKIGIVKTNLVAGQCPSYRHFASHIHPLDTCGASGRGIYSAVFPHVMPEKCLLSRHEDVMILDFNHRLILRGKGDGLHYMYRVGILLHLKTHFASVIHLPHGGEEQGDAIPPVGELIAVVFHSPVPGYVGAHRHIVHFLSPYCTSEFPYCTGLRLDGLTVTTFGKGFDLPTANAGKS